MTPILDLEQEPPRAPGRWIWWGIGLLLGAMIDVVLFLGASNRLPAWHWPAFNGLLMLPVWFAAIALHEAGHLGAAKLVGLENGGIAVAGFVLSKSGKNWVCRFDPRVWACGFFKPLVKTVQVDAGRYACMVAGGPLTSFVTALVTAVVCAREGSGVWEVTGTLFWTSLFTGLISLLPLPSSMGKTDGTLLWLLLRCPQRVRTWMALVALQTEEAHGVRPRDWDAGLMEQVLKEEGSGSEFLIGQLLAYYRRLDEGRNVEALEHLENALARSGRMRKSWRREVFLEASTASALIRKDAAQARRWLGRACRLRAKSLEATDAAISMCEKRYAAAAERWQAAREMLLRRKLDSGVSRFALEKWAEYEQACRMVLEGSA